MKINHLSPVERNVLIHLQIDIIRIECARFYKLFAHESRVNHSEDISTSPTTMRSYAADTGQICKC